jgi:RNA polymerase-binding transcription factor DksA
MAQPSRKLLRALELRERELRRRIAERRDALEAATHVPEPTGDAADMAFGRTRAEVEHDLMELSLKELAGIAAARERASAGTYGECVDCGEPIARERLAANPAALRCAACQARREKSFGAG